VRNRCVIMILYWLTWCHCLFVLLKYNISNQVVPNSSSGQHAPLHHKACSHGSVLDRAAALATPSHIPLSSKFRLIQTGVNFPAWLAPRRVPWKKSDSKRILNTG